MNEEKKAFTHEAKTSACPHCGSGDLQPGKFSTGMVFRPDNAPFLSMTTAEIPVRANMCMDCGRLDFVADVDRAAKVMKRPAKPI